MILGIWITENSNTDMSIYSLKTCLKIKKPSTAPSNALLATLTAL